MYTPTNAYNKKISSGTLLFILAFSGLLFAIPLSTPVSAANATLPTVTITVGAPLKGTASSAITFTLKNPASNQYAITAFTLVAPAGWTVTACTHGLLFTTAVL